MDADFWIERWREGKIGFHEGRPNTYLVRHVALLGAGRRVLVPLCGKTVDLAFLAGLGHTVIGVELVEDAARGFFEGASPEITKHGEHVAYRAGGVTIFVGDYFATTPELLGPIDALYDRAALIALPPELRRRYAAHTRALVGAGAPGLLITLEYDQAKMSGPPFSVDEAEVRALHAGVTVDRIDEGATESPRLRELGVTAVERCYELQL